MSLGDLPQPATAATAASQNPLAQVLPKFRFKSVLGAALALELVFYIVSLWVVVPRGIVDPKPLANWKLGSSDYIMERCVTAVGGKYIWELRRLIVPIFLHNGLLHILMNGLFQVLAGPRALDTYGPRGFTCIFLCSGMCGNLLSDAFEHRGVGASTACYGLIGAFAAQIWLQWNKIEEAWRKWTRNMMILYAVFLVIWELIGWNSIDHFAHLGGLLSGFCLAVMLDAEAPKIRRRICACTFTVGVLSSVIKIFFLASEADMGGHKYPWSLACAGQSGLYDRDS